MLTDPKVHETGSKQYVVADGNGIAFGLTGSNRNDVTQVMPLLRSIRRCGDSAAGPAGDPGY
ncbi:hypothetical protein [Nonomuraea sp. NPDC049625]|uniref:hypothetical protein n=1 Tax=Nonomuraea sp. NPDC049625 TaxID=3155775 RepID=UPI00341FDF82